MMTMSISTDFTIFLGCVLGFIILLQLLLMVLVYKHRNTSTLRLHQPHVLLVYVAISTFTTGSCILFIPFNDTSCMILDLFILLPLTSMGNILVARSWRLNTLMTPALGIRRDDSSSKRRRIVKQYLMNWLTLLVKIFDKKLRRSTVVSRRSSTSLQQEVTILQLTLLTIILTIPQLVVQICKLCIPSLRSELDEEPECYETSTGGEVMRWVGVVFAIIPLIMLVILSLYNGGLPLLKMYGTSVLQSIAILIGSALIACPSIYMSVSLETKAYLQSSIVNSFTIGTVWLVVAQKLLLTFKNEKEKDNKTMLRVEKKQHLEGIDSEECEKSANAALQIGKVYEDYGMFDKCVKIYDDAINLFKFEPRKQGISLVGGFSETEMKTFTHVDLASILKLFSAKGKVVASSQCAELIAAAASPDRVYSDALEIYEKCPSAAILDDHSIVFPIFSGLFLQIKTGKVDIDETVLVDKFVKVAKLNGDDIHFLRALAMKGEVNSRLGNYKTALFASALIDSVYDANVHHEGICKSYGSDRAAQALSASIIWNRHLGNDDEAERLVHFLLEKILPKSDPRNVHNMAMLILPLVKVMKEDGQYKEARDLFEEHVCKNFALYFGDDGKTPCLVIFKPIMYLLDINIHGSNTPNLNEIIEWSAEDMNGVSTEFLDSAVTFWSPHSIMAELCLELSKLANDDEINKDKLVQKSIKLARGSLEKSIDQMSAGSRLSSLRNLMSTTIRIEHPMVFGDIDWILSELDNDYESGNYKVIVDGKEEEYCARRKAAGSRRHSDDPEDSTILKTADMRSTAKTLRTSFIY